MPEADHKTYMRAVCAALRQATKYDAFGNEEPPETEAPQEEAQQMLTRPFFVRVRNYGMTMYG